MLLVVDVGNTQTKAAVISQKRILGKQTFLTTELLNYPHFFLDYLASPTLSSTNSVVLCSVVPKLSKQLSPFLKKKFPNFLEISSSLTLPFKMKYKTPLSLGADRLCLATFGWSLSQEKKSPTIIISAGTATTIDVVTPTAYLGGLIAASPSLSLQILSDKTASLPLVAFTKRRNPIGNSTTSALLSGAYWNFIGGIASAINEIDLQLGTKAYVFATGGNADLLCSEPLLKKRVIIERHAVFKGAKTLFDINQR